MAPGPSGGDGRHIGDLHPGHLLQVGLAVPSAEEGDPAHKEPEAEDQGQEQDRGQDTVLRLQHAEEQDRQDPADLDRDQRLRDQHPALLSGVSGRG